MPTVLREYEDNETIKELSALEYTAAVSLSYD
jgi:hypothetical protein